MSLYGTPAKSQRQTIDRSQSPELPKWLSMLTWWVFAATLLTGVYRTVTWIRAGYLTPKDFGFVLNGVSALIAAGLFLFYIYRSKSWILWYSILMTLVEAGREGIHNFELTTSGHHYYLIPNGLYFFPLDIFDVLIDYVFPAYYIHSFVYLLSPLLAVGLCVLLLYFHAKRTPQAQVAE